MADLRRRFSQVDVFTDTPLRGNPVAVVHDSAGLTTEQMQAFTNWTNLSEATFLGPPTHPDADYSVRIFCPGRELAFAGHPTLGSCHAWLESGGRPRGSDIVQECGIGLVRIRRDSGLQTLAFAAPERRRSGPLAPADLDAVVAYLGVAPERVLAHEWGDNGPGWRMVLLATAQDVLDLVPDSSRLHGMDIGVAGPHPAGSPVDLEVRAFFPGNSGPAEDPVTGSLNAALGQWLIGSARLPESYLAAQGTCVDRAGRVRVERVAGQVWIGGGCTTVLSGTARL